MKKLLVGVVLLLSCVHPAHAATVVDPDITTDTVWTKDASPYVVNDFLWLHEGATLTIEPGVSVEFDPDSIFIVSGTLKANGSEGEPIRFSSQGRWSLGFEYESGPSLLAHTSLVNTEFIIDVSPNRLTLSHVAVKDSQEGLQVFGADLDVDSSSFTHMGDETIDISASRARLTHVVITDAYSGLQVYNQSELQASDLTLDRVSREALAVYGKSFVQVRDAAILHTANESVAVWDTSSISLADTRIEDSLASNVVGTYDASSLEAVRLTLSHGEGDGIEVYGSSRAVLTDSTVSDFPQGAGIAVYARERDLPRLELTNVELTHNDTGLALFAPRADLRLESSALRDNASAGLATYDTLSVDARNTYWGDASGPFNEYKNPTGIGNAVIEEPGSSVAFAPWLTSWPPRKPSNVLFLPGVEGSRLYEGADCDRTEGEKLWEPTNGSLLDALTGIADKRVKALAFDLNARSVCATIYTKPQDVVDKVAGTRVYQSFIDTMNELVADGTITDWRAAAYDWRFALNSLLTSGAERDGRVYFDEASSTPLIEQTLRELAISSKSGKVTIVTHSNGGLVAKALLNKLGSEAPTLVDKVIMVAPPLSGAPMAVAALLYGYKQGIALDTILQTYVARAFVQNLPMAYHLLPSEDYLESTLPDLTAHPLVRFSGAGYSKEVAAYGPTIANRVALADFLTAKEGGRTKPKEKDVNSAEVLNAKLIDYAVSQHATLDAWYPPQGIEVDQIAGWGVDTLAGIEHYSTPGKSNRLYRPLITEDGDGTVTTPSALQIASSTQVKRLWVNLDFYRVATSITLKHDNIFEMPQLESLITARVKNASEPLPTYFSQVAPTPVSPEKRLLFILHSPLTLELANTANELTGITREGLILQEIPASHYQELGEVKYVLAPEGEYTLTLRGQDAGTFSLDVQELVGGIVTASTTFAELPTTASTTATISIKGGLDSLSPLTVDEDGDGTADITLAPELGQTVIYQPPVPKSSPPPTSPPGSGGAGAISIPIVSVATTTAPKVSTPATTTTQSAVKLATKAPPSPKKQITFVSLPVSEPTSTPKTSQHSRPQGFTAAVYNGWVSFWSILTKFF